MTGTTGQKDNAKAISLKEQGISARSAKTWVGIDPENLLDRKEPYRTSRETEIKVLL